jgi:hypothetical protein
MSSHDSGDSHSQDSRSSDGSLDSCSSQSISPSIIPARRPNRSEYAAYATLLRDLDARDRSNLSKSLFLQNLSNQLPEDSERRAPQLTKQASSSRLRSVDKHIATLSTLWPLSPEELYEPPASLSEYISAVSVTCIRRLCQTLPSARNAHPEFDEEQNLSCSLTSAVTEYINEILITLAVMRPVALAKDRKSLPELTWENVLGAGGRCGTSRSATRHTESGLFRSLRRSGNRLEAIHGFPSANIHRQFGYSIPTSCSRSQE